MAVRADNTSKPKPLVIRSLPALAKVNATEFDFTGLRIFTSVPDHPDFGIVTLQGMVAIYDERPLRHEGIIQGAFYVRESQRPRSGLTWDTWLSLERDDPQRRSGPTGPLAIRREVVRAIDWPSAGQHSVRLASGHVDGPYTEASFGSDFIGKVVGFYLPATGGQE